MIKPSKNPIEKDFEAYVASGMDLMHNKQNRGNILTILRSNDKIRALTDALLLVIHKLDNATRSKGVEVDDAIKRFAAEKFLTQLIEVANAAGLYEVSEQEKVFILAQAIQIYVQEEITAGRIDKAKLEAQTAKAIRAMSPEQRQEMQNTFMQIQETAKAYNQGQ